MTRITGYGVDVKVNDRKAYTKRFRTVHEWLGEASVLHGRVETPSSMTLIEAGNVVIVSDPAFNGVFGISDISKGSRKRIKIVLAKIVRERVYFYRNMYEKDKTAER